MRIHLCRHFKVNLSFPFFSDGQQFNRLMKKYDESDVIIKEVNFKKRVFTRCFSSNLKRAVITAESVYSGEIKKTNLLNEVPLESAFNLKFGIPTILWLIMGRWLWFINSRKPTEKRSETLTRAETFYQRYCLPFKKENLDILVVTHGFFIQVFSRFLAKEGFRSKQIFRVKHAYPYLFEYKN